VQAPTRSELIVNLKTAKALGLAALTAWTRRQGDRTEMPFDGAGGSDDFAVIV
jgi:hypothetical protein